VGGASGEPADGGVEGCPWAKVNTGIESATNNVNSTAALKIVLCATTNPPFSVSRCFLLDQFDRVIGSAATAVPKKAIKLSY
jgi:hypothetical protein